jgi:transposase
MRPARGRIFVATAATDLRKSYDGLAALVEGTFGRDLFAGDLFVFLNQRATQIRILYWNSAGHCIWMQRLEAGTFRRFTSDAAVDVVEIDPAELAMLIEGIDAALIKRRKRYRRAHHQTDASVVTGLQS